MDTMELLRTNLTSPICLAFALGVLARLVRSELSLPRDLYTSLGIYLLLALGLKGGVELSHRSFAEIFRPAVVTLLLGGRQRPGGGRPRLAPTFVFLRSLK